MRSQKANQKLKRLMLDYELGAMNYDTYRHRRNEIIDEFAGKEKRHLNELTNIMPKRQPTTKKVSTYRAIFTLCLVVLAAVITYIAVKKDIIQEQEQFVDSRIPSEDAEKASAPE